MKRVIDSVNVKIIEVSKDSIECSVCKEWRPESEYCGDNGTGPRTRTNCFRCYNDIGWKEMNELEEETLHKIKSNFYNLTNLRAKLRHRNALFGSSITVGDLKKALSNMDDDARLFISDYEEDCIDIDPDPSNNFREEIEGIKFYSLS